MPVAPLPQAPGEAWAPAGAARGDHPLQALHPNAVRARRQGSALELVQIRPSTAPSFRELVRRACHSVRAQSLIQTRVEAARAQRLRFRPACCRSSVALISSGNLS